MKLLFVYILCSDRNGTLYTGVTSDLKKRVYEHKSKFVDGFTGKHGVDKLVWYEVHEDARSAVTRERQIKKWMRSWKIEMIEKFNPYWNDLYEEI
ncbi:MAG: GIY-YIG nuclease family protein [Nitrospirae bacterium]|nr:GIY-YIG nuclease family protein [Nitrospirota bacterium]